MERGHTNGRMVPPPHEYDNHIHPHEYVNRIHSWLKMWGRQSSTWPLHVTLGDGKYCFKGGGIGQ